MPKGPNDYPKIEFRAGELLAPLQERTTPNGFSPDVIAKRDLARYYALLADELRSLDPPLTVGEACLLMDVLNGTFLDEHTYRFLVVEVSDGITLNQVDRKWDVDGPALVARVAAMSPGQRLALVDAAERFWLHPEQDTDELLRRVGLVR